MPVLPVASPHPMMPTSAGGAAASAHPSSGPARHFNIVALEALFTPLPPIVLPAPHTFTLTEHQRTTAAQVPDRIRDADILIITTVPLSAAALSEDTSPRLQLIAVISSGTDTLDLAACRKRGIRVLNSPECNADAVAEHAVALYFATRRTLLPAMRDLRAGEWHQKGTLFKSAFAAGKPPRSCSQETVAIIGYGGVGRRVARLFTGLGMRILVAGRKSQSASETAEGRVAFAEALRAASVLVLCCPRTPDTIGLLSGPEFSALPKDAVVINVARGGVVDEEALLVALETGEIAGAGTDVYGKEPAGPDTSPLLGSRSDKVNLVATPHMAWVASETDVNYQRVLLENIQGFILGEVQPERIKA